MPNEKKQSTSKKRATKKVAKKEQEPEKVEEVGDCSIAYHVRVTKDEDAIAEVKGKVTLPEMFTKHSIPDASNDFKNTIETLVTRPLLRKVNNLIQEEMEKFYPKYTLSDKIDTIPDDITLGLQKQLSGDSGDSEAFDVTMEDIQNAEDQQEND